MTLPLSVAHQRYERELAWSEALDEWLEETVIDDILWKGNWNNELFLDEILEKCLELNGDEFDEFFIVTAMLVASREKDFAMADYERYVRKMVEWYILDHLTANHFTESYDQYLEDMRDDY